MKNTENTALKWIPHVSQVQNVTKYLSDVGGHLEKFLFAAIYGCSQTNTQRKKGTKTVPLGHHFGELCLFQQKGHYYGQQHISNKMSLPVN